MFQQQNSLLGMFALFRGVIEVLISKKVECLVKSLKDLIFITVIEIQKACFSEPKLFGEPIIGAITSYSQL